MSQQQRIARNTVLAIIGVAAAGIVRVVFTVAVGRELGPALLGDIAVILAVAVITTIPAAGIGAAANRYLAVASGAGDITMRRNVLGATWRAALIVTATAVVLSWAYLNLQGATQFDALTLTFGLTFVASYGLYLVSKAVLFGDGRAEKYAIGEFIGVVAFAVSLALVLLLSPSVAWMLSTQVVWVLGVVLIATVIGLGPLRLLGRAESGFWSFATTATVGSLVSLGVIQATVLVMAGMHGSVQAGLLAAVLAVTAPLYLLPRALSLALTPAMSSHVGAGSKKRADLDAEYTTTVLVIVGGISAAAIIAVADLVLAIYGAGFAEARNYLLIFAVASFIVIIGIPVVNRFASEGAKALRVTVVASSFGALAAAAIWFTLGRDEPMWIAGGFLVSAIVRTAIPFAMSKRVVGARISPPVGLTVVFGGGIAAALLVAPWSFILLALVTVASIPLLFIATVRYRADAALLAADRGDLVVGVITNMYPSEPNPYSGVFVRDRVTAYRELGATVIVVSPTHHRGVLKYLALAGSSLRSLLREPIPDVFEVHPTQPTGVIGMVVARTARRPYILYAHGSDVGIVARWSLHRRLVDAAAGGAREFHTNSAYTADRVTERWSPRSGVRVLPPGVALPDSVESRERRNIDLLFVGTLNHGKGVDVLLDALAGIPNNTGLEIMIVGGGPERERLEERALKHDLDVHFTGVLHPDHVHEMMARARLLAVPSRHEALGQVAVEALAQGTPIIVSDVGGLGSVPTPECGSTVPAEDPGALRSELQRWLDMTQDEWEVASHAAHERGADFEVGAIAQRALDRLQEVAAERRTGSSDFSGV